MPTKDDDSKKSRNNPPDREQTAFVEKLGRPRANAIFEPAKPEKKPGKLAQSFASHKLFLGLITGKKEVPQDMLDKIHEDKKSAAERGIWIKPFEVSPKRRSIGEGNASHLNFLKVLGGGGRIPEEEVKDRAAKKAFLDQWQKTHPGEEPDDSMGDPHEGQVGMKNAFKLKGIKAGYQSHKAFLSEIFGKGKVAKEKEALQKQEKSAEQQPHTKRKPAPKMSLGFSFESAKSKFQQRAGAFAKKLGDSFVAKGGGKGFKHFKEMAAKLLSGKSTQSIDNKGTLPKFSAQVDLSKAPKQFSAKTQPGINFKSKPQSAQTSNQPHSPDQNKPFTLKVPQAKPFTMAKAQNRPFKMATAKSAH